MIKTYTYDLFVFAFFDPHAYLARKKIGSERERRMVAERERDGKREGRDVQERGRDEES